MARIHCKHKKYKKKPLLNELCRKREKVLAWVKEKRKRMDKKDYSKYDYPACIVACTCSRITKRIYSERCAKTDIKVYQRNGFIKELLKIGSYGQPVKPKGNRIGYCAEQRVAASILNDNPGLLFSDIEFSYAVRPRTAKIIAYCDNCKAIFPQL